MTDEATPSGGAESATETAAAPAQESKPLSDVERLKAFLGGKPKEAPAPQPEPSPAPDEGKPAEAKAPETDSTTESEDAEAPKTETAASTPPDLAAVAKMLGVSPAELVIDDDGTLAFKTKVDGIEGKAKPTDLRKSFQLEAAHTRRLMELSEKEKAFRAEQEAKASEIQARTQQIDQYLAVAQAELYRDFNGTDWNALKVTDPVEFNSRWIDLQTRQANLNQALEARKAEQERVSKEAEAAEAKRLESEYRELLNHVPSWSEKATRDKFVSGLRDTYGLSDEGISAIARSSNIGIRIVMDALKWHDAQAEAKKAKAEVLKKVEAAPPMAKPGAPAAPQNQRNALDKTRVAFRKSGGRMDIGAQALKQMGLVGRKSK